MTQPSIPVLVPDRRRHLRLRSLVRPLRAAGFVVDVCGDEDLFDVTADSRDVDSGMLFCAVRGAHTDGHRHVEEAVARGASALLVERWTRAALPQLRVSFARPAVGTAAATVHHNPTGTLPVVAVTGTNGKTTTTFLARSAMEAGGLSVGVVGTLGVFYAGRSVETSKTLPESWQLQRIFAAMLRTGIDSVLMEASSQGLDQDRLAGTAVALAVWLNLAPEHLEYHGTMEQYYAAKARLFEPALTRRGLVCTDDEWGRRLAAQARIPITTFGVRPDADVHVDVVRTGLAGTTVRMRGPHADLGGETIVTTPLVGAVNAANVAAAYLIARAFGVQSRDAARGLATAPPVPGRFQCVRAGQPFLVVSDYAHTPDSLEKLLMTARSLVGPGGRVSLVLGCRGGRDRYKRPLMGHVAAAGADHAYFTTDSPDAEDPRAIVAQMMAGAIQTPGHRIDVELDRRAAIYAAIAEAAPGDAVLITGRGHETRRLLGGRVERFVDHEAAAEALAYQGFGVADHSDLSPAVEAWE